MSQENAQTAKNVLELAQVRNEAYIETLKTQRNNAQDQAALVAAENAALRKLAEKSRENEKAQAAEIERLAEALRVAIRSKADLDNQVLQLKAKLDAATVPVGAGSRSRKTSAQKG